MNDLCHSIIKKWEIIIISVTGGAGYIGVKFGKIKKKKFNPITFDNLSTGKKNW